MTLKRRILISNILIVFIPLAIAFISMYVYWSIITSIGQTKFSIDDTLHYLNIEARFISLSEYMHINDADEFLSEKVQWDLSELLSDINGKYYLEKDGEEIRSTIILSQQDIQNSINAAKNPADRFVNIGKANYNVRYYKLLFSDSSEGLLLLFAPLKDNVEYYYMSVIVGGLAFFVSFIVVNTLVYYFLKKTFVDPVNELKNATDNIAKGNLDFFIAEGGDEEIKSLCRSFEKMRLKLKESVDLKLKYEENRKILITSISHDLKTPITSIKGYVEGLMDGVADTDEKKKKYLKIIHEKALLTDLMIDDLLLYSKLDLNQVPFDFKNINIVELLEDIVLEYRLIHKNINFIFSNKIKMTDEPVVNCDACKITRVFTNIINNSIKYVNRQGGIVEIIIRQGDKNFVIEFNDNGPGIPAKDVNLVFSQFYRGDSSRKSGSGTGLGLAISKQIVELHQGHIWIISEEGKGTSVRVSLPIHK